MPLVAHNSLPTFNRLRADGQTVLTEKSAKHQDIREQHIGLLNMMPDAALQATERQFFRLIGESNAITQFYMHPFTLPELKRGKDASAHIEKYYESFDEIQHEGLDALIITGANVTGVELSSQVFWKPLIHVIDWAEKNVTSTLCSCLATHAVLEFRYGQKRILQPEKTWGIFPHQVVNKRHPVVGDINTRFNVPHSRWNKVTPQQFKNAGLHVLDDSEVGVHLAASHDGIRFLFFQGHQEYDSISLLKEYKRDLRQYAMGESQQLPPFPANYLGLREQAILIEYYKQLTTAMRRQQEPPEFPEALIAPHIDNTWHDTAKSVVGNWMGCIYQITHPDRRKAFMDNIDPNNPLGINP